MTYVAESSPDKRRNSLGSGLEIGTLSGYIAASIMIAILSFFLNHDQMQAWGWRIPFILGLFLGLFGLIYVVNLKNHLYMKMMLRLRHKEITLDSLQLSVTTTKIF